jgi:hypothetical protein
MCAGETLIIIIKEKNWIRLEYSFAYTYAEQ